MKKWTKLASSGHQILIQIWNLSFPQGPNRIEYLGRKQQINPIGKYNLSIKITIPCCTHGPQKIFVLQGYKQLIKNNVQPKKCCP